MQSQREPLAGTGDGSSFTVAQGLAAGLGRGRMRGADLSRPFRGVRVPRVAFPADPTTGSPPTEWGADEWRRYCSALLVALPEHSCSSHLTAARVWSVPLPGRPDDEPVHVGTMVPSRPPRRTGVVGHELSDPLAHVVARGGLPIIDPATMFCQLASSLSVTDLVAVGDALVLQPVVPDPLDERPWVDQAQLLERVDQFRGRGKTKAAKAAELIRPGAESRPETLMRLAIIRAGLPEPEVNANVLSEHGRFIGRGDLVYRRWRVIVEYDGDQHRTDTLQFDRDIQRLEDFASNGWQVVRVAGRSFFLDRDAAVQRINQALWRAGWRP